MSAPVTHLEILGPDRAALATFYATVFEWSLTPIDEANYTMFAAAEGGIGGGLGTPENGEASVCLYAEVDDLDAALALAVELGASGVTDPIALDESSRIGTFRDPAGNPFGLYQGPSSEEPPKGPGAPVAWFDIIGAPAAGLRDFYAKLLGWEYDVSDEYAHVRPASRGIGGGIMAPHPGQPERALLAYMHVANLEETLGRITGAGGSVVMGRMNVGEGLDIAWFTDVAGNVNGLFERTADSA